MKNKKFAKISLLVLTLALCLSAIFAITIHANTETTPFTSLEILSQNIFIDDDFRLAYAVEASDGYEGEVKLYVYEADPEVDTSVLPKDTITVSAPKAPAETSNLYGKVDKYYEFITNVGVSFNALDTNFYVQAEATSGTETVKSAVKRYSVAEYLYQRLATVPTTDANGKQNPSDEQIEFYNATITWGTKAQAVYGDENATPISDLRYVVIGEEDNSVLDSKFKAGVYAKGSTLPLSIPDVAGAKWTVVGYDINGYEIEGTKAENQATATVPTADGVIKVLVTTGAVFSYRDGYNNLNDLTSVPSFFAYANKPAGVPELLSDAERGNYINMDISSPNAQSPYVKITPDSSISGTVTKEEATAFEASFDVKISSPASISKDANEIIGFGFRDSSNTSIANVYLYTWHTTDSANNTLRIVKGTGATGDTQYVENVDTTDWYHVRFVIYKGDHRLFVYVNGSSTPAIYTISHTKNLSFDDISYLRIDNSKNYTENTNLSIDNVFCGYINDANPDAANAVTPPAAAQ